MRYSAPRPSRHIIEMPSPHLYSARRPFILPRNCLNGSIAAPQALSTLSGDALRHFDSLGICRRREPHTVLFHEGLPADHLHILSAGRVKVTASSSKGRLFLLRVASPGDILGLAALQEHATHRVSAETLSACTIRSIPRADFLRLMASHPDVSRITALAIAREYNSALLSARRLAHHVSAAGKLASTLLDWAQMDNTSASPTHTSLPISFLMQLNQEDLGSMAGLSRETVSRLLARFRREGLIEQTDDHMTLNNPIRLEARYR
jgi:CRP/FNR family cyclic AMP-dependent transcriptional regulator